MGSKHKKCLVPYACASAADRVCTCHCVVLIRMCIRGASAELITSRSGLASPYSRSKLRSLIERNSVIINNIVIVSPLLTLAMWGAGPFLVEL